MVLENIHTNPMDGHGNSKGVGGLQSQNKGKYGAKLEFLEGRGGGAETKTPSMGEEWIFSRTICQSTCINRVVDLMSLGGVSGLFMTTQHKLRLVVE